MLSKVSSFSGPNSLFNNMSATPSLVLSLDAFGYVGSGTWNDLSKLNNDATPDGPISFDTEVDGCFIFDGSSASFVFATVSGIPIGDSQYTIETWFKSDSYDPIEQGPLIGWGTIGIGTQSNVLRLNANGFTNYWWGNDISATFIGTQSMITDNWYYVVSTYDGTNRRIYLNGYLVAIDTPSGPHQINDISTLKIGYDGLNYFNGKISKVKIRTKAISSSRILSNFNSDKVRHGYVFGSLYFDWNLSSKLISSSSDYAFGTGDFTIEAFFKLIGSPYFQYGGIVSLRGNNSYTDGVNINLQNTNSESPLIEFSVGGSYITYTASNNLWYHTAISRIGSTSSVYVNGELLSEVSDLTDYQNNDLVIGRYYTDLDTHYTYGVISNIRVINGTGLYSGATLTLPKTPLEPITNTKLLINSQKTYPTGDVSGLFRSVTASNVGWTSSVPFFEIIQFNYPNFSDTTGLFLYSYMNITNNYIYLTNLSNSNVGNIFTDAAIKFNRNFTLEWTFECTGGSGADGYSVQWTTVNNVSGGSGGDCGKITTAINCFSFRTYFNNEIIHYEFDNIIDNQSIIPFTFRQNVHYWFDYDFDTSTVNIYYDTVNTKPALPNHTFTSVIFDNNNYYLGFGAANGGSTDYHILKSLKLVFPTI